MTAKNDITGDSIVTKTSNDSYRDNWDRIFGKKKTQARYQHSSMFGTYTVPCIILEELHEEYRIQFHDQWINENCERIVPKSLVCFE